MIHLGFHRFDQFELGAAAVEILIGAAGFEVNVAGKVISQKPELNGLNRYKQYSTATAIVIVIGKGVLR